jgi:hypothetical protein
MTYFCAAFWSFCHSGRISSLHLVSSYITILKPLILNDLEMHKKKNVNQLNFSLKKTQSYHSLLIHEIKNVRRE